MATIAQNQAKVQQQISNLQKQVSRNNNKMNNNKQRRSRKPRSNPNRKQGNPRRMAPRRNPQVVLSRPMHQYLSCLTDPFGAVGAPAPDEYVGNTIIMKDYIGQGQYEIFASTTATGGNPSTPTGGSITGVCYFIVPGYAEANTFYSSTYSNIDDSTTDYSPYHLAACGINSNGQLCKIDDLQDYYNCIPSSNLATMFNLANYSDSLCEGGRVISYGLRVWPVIEVITDSNTLAVAQFWAGEMPFAALCQDFLNFQGTQKSIYAGVQSSPNFKTYNNSKGVTVRLNALQNNYLSVKTLNTWNDQTYYTDNLTIPVIVVKFTQTITGNNTEGQDTQTYFDTLPIYVETITWLENIVQVPTPLISTQSPIDHAFLSVRMTILASGKSLFPTITEGHSFKRFATKLGAYAKHALNFIDNSSRVARKGLQHYNNFTSDL